MSKQALEAEDRAASYEEDFYLWLLGQAEMLRQGRFQDLDLENLAEEVEDIGRSQRHAAESALGVVIIHLLKYEFQPSRRSRSWLDTLLEHRSRLGSAFQESRSLRLHSEAKLGDVYRLARKRAAIQTGMSVSAFPEACPYTLEQLLDEDFFPEAKHG